VNKLKNTYWNFTTFEEMYLSSLDAVKQRFTNARKSFQGLALGSWTPDWEPEKNNDYAKHGACLLSWLRPWGTLNKADVM